MNFLKSAYKQLQELDETDGKPADIAGEDTSGERPNRLDAAQKKLEDFNLEARLEGAASRMLSWVGTDAASAIRPSQTTPPPLESAGRESQRGEADGETPWETSWSDSEGSEADTPAPQSEGAVQTAEAAPSRDLEPPAKAYAAEEAEQELDTPDMEEGEPPEADRCQGMNTAAVEHHIACAAQQADVVEDVQVAEDDAGKASVQAHVSTDAHATPEVEAGHAVATGAAGNVLGSAIVDDPHESAVELQSDPVSLPAAYAAPVPDRSGPEEHFIGSFHGAETISDNGSPCHAADVASPLAAHPEEEEERPNHDIEHAAGTLCAESEAYRELEELKKELHLARNHLGQRERQLAELSQHLADKEAAEVAFRDAEAEHATQVEKAAEARLREVRKTWEKDTAESRKTAEKEAASLRRRAEAAETARDKALRNAEILAERTERAERKQKEDANDTERELLEAQETWRKKITAAEHRAAETAGEAQQQVAAIASQLEKSRADTDRLRHELDAARTGEDATVKEYEGNLASSTTENHRLSERLRASAEVELQLRRELASLDQGRAQIQERCSELENQLERVQAAYSDAAQEVGAMSARLHELEFGSQVADRPSHLEEQLLDAQRRLEERATAQAQAVRQLEEMRALQAAQFISHQAELAKALTAAAAATAATAATAAAEGTRASTAGESAEAPHLCEHAQEVDTQVADLERRHSEDLKKQAQLFRDETEYLKRKNDEKDRRLEVLICERNTLRFESAEQQKVASASSTNRDASRKSKGSTPDLEDGLGTPADAERGCMKDGDALMRRFSRVLFISPLTRRIFYGYMVLLHIWIWVVLHRAAALHTQHH